MIGWCVDREFRWHEKNNDKSKSKYNEIDLFKCIYCGFCEESCPVDSIVETSESEFALLARGQNILDKNLLLAIGDKYEQKIATERAEDAPYR